MAHNGGRNTGGTKLKAAVAQMHCIARYTKLGSLRAKLADLLAWKKLGFVPKSAEKDHNKEISIAKRAIREEMEKIGVSSYTRCQNDPNLECPEEMLYEECSEDVEEDDAWVACDDDSYNDTEGSSGEYDNQYAEGERWARYAKLYRESGGVE